MPRKLSGKPAHRPRAKQFNWKAKPDYPFVVWPFGVNGKHGFVVEYPDLVLVELVSELELQDAIAAAQKNLSSARKKPAFSDFNGRSVVGLPPNPPIRRLTRLQNMATSIEAKAIAERRTTAPQPKRGRPSRMGWAIAPERLLETLGDMGIDETKLPDARTVVRWRNEPVYIGAVLSALLAIGGT